MHKINLSYLARISACNAKIEGMKAENAHRLASGKGVAYTEKEFFAVAAELKQLSDDVMHCA